MFHKIKQILSVHLFLPYFPISPKNTDTDKFAATQLPGLCSRDRWSQALLSLLGTIKPWFSNLSPTWFMSHILFLVLCPLSLYDDAFWCMCCMSQWLQRYTRSDLNDPRAWLVGNFHQHCQQPNCDPSKQGTAPRMLKLTSFYHGVTVKTGTMLLKLCPHV